jgi:hypothetical protein
MDNERGLKMALNIPLPLAPGQMLLKGAQTGGNLFQQFMSPIIEREKQKQLENHFQQQLQLSKAAAGRAAQAASDAHKLALMKMDPLYEAKQFEALENYFKGRKNQDASRGSPIPEALPREIMGEGLGMFTPEGLAQQQENVQSKIPNEAPSNNPMGMDLELMKAHPMLRGWYKHHFGVDPLAPVAQTPEQKQAAILDTFKKKEEFKAQQEQKLPAAIKTLHENIIHLSPKAIKAIQHIIDIPSPFEPWGLGIIKSGQKAAHTKAVTAAAENYAKAKGWPNTKGSIEKAESILQRGHFETDFDYRKRLREYQDELNEGIENSSSFLHPNKRLPTNDNNVIEYVRENGKLVPKKVKS